MSTSNRVSVITGTERYMRQAYVLARQSPDLSTQNGGVLVKNNKIIGWGNNSLPLGAAVTPERLERPAKYLWTEHAERNCIYSTAALGGDTNGSTMYCLWAACHDCARAIVNAGVRRLVTHSFYAPDNERWGESIEVGYAMFEECGVQLEFTDVKVMQPGESLLYNGEKVTF